jgi:hypothetical protein
VNDNTLMVPDRCLDPSRPKVESWFNSLENGFTLSRHDSPISWRCIDNHMPCVVSYQSGPRGAESFVTDKGLSVYADPSPAAAEKLGKREGDYWIDFPLMKGSSIMGKLSIPCDPKLTPERFQMFEILAGIVGESLLRVAEREHATFWPGQIADRIRTETSKMLEELSPLQVALALMEQESPPSHLGAESYWMNFRSALMSLHDRITLLPRVARSE